jgi:uncharacterized protein (TIGR02757 family)
MKLKYNNLKETLDRFYLDYPFQERLRHDPIEFPKRYKSRQDMEASGFISCSFAYGRVELFKPVVEKLLSLMDENPHAFLSDFNAMKEKRRFEGIKYRFNSNEDVLGLFHILSSILKKNGSLEAAFKSFYRAGDINTGGMLSGMMEYIRSIDTSAVYGSDIHPPGLLQFFPSPESGGACKRANLFLRWMARDRDIDFGLWKWIPKNKLIIPLDTHIMRVSRCLGFTGRKAADWKAAVEITEALKELDPEDPLKYDFALCHHGIAGICRPDKKGCKDCPFSY